MDDINLQEDIVEILCYLPKKSLGRFKCVSKQWLALISNRSRVFPKTTTSHSGLVFQTSLPCELRSPKASSNVQETEQQHSRMNFLHVDNQGQAFRLPHSHPTNGIDHNEEENIDGLLVSSCNGFLLYRKQQKSETDFVVFHPATKRSWYVPRPKDAIVMHVGLISDSHHFKIMLFSIYGNSPPGSSVWYEAFQYSSESEEWNEENWKSFEVHIPSCSPKPIDSGKSVFLDGALYWIWGNYLVIYYFENQDCELIKFPKFPNNGGRKKWPDQCIWDSEGLLSYCQVSADGDRIGIWTLLDKGWNNIRRVYSFRWMSEHYGILSPSAREIGHPFSPFAFNDDFEIVYLMCGRRIFSYCLATKELKEACPSPFEGSDDRALCIALPFQFLSQWEMAAKAIGDKEKGDPLSCEAAKRGKQL